MSIRWIEAIKDKFLVPPEAGVRTSVKGIRYEDLSEEEKDQWDALRAKFPMRSAQRRSIDGSSTRRQDERDGARAEVGAAEIAWARPLSSPRITIMRSSS